MNRTKPKRMALKLTLLLLFFIAPMIAALFVYQARDNLHFISKNAGNLIFPSVQLEEIGLDPLEQRWWMAYYTPGTCDAECVETLEHFNTMYASLIKDQHRLGSVLITEQQNNKLPEKFSQLQIQTLQQPLPAHLLQENQNTAIWLIDPIGNIVLSYDPQTLDNLMLIDLRHLLKVSQIG